MTATCTDADYYFGSLRKWCGIWTGGYAWTQDGHKIRFEKNNDIGYISLRKIAMEMKACYMKHALEFKDNNNNKSYLQVFEKAEELLEQIGIVSASERDILAAQKLDINFIKTQRIKNAQILLRAFSEQALFPTLKSDDCPLFVPILVPHGKRDALRKYLIQRDIYCPVHWPLSNYHVLNEQTESLYRNEISLVCDQRYTDEDMERIVDTINNFWKDN